MSYNPFNHPKSKPMKRFETIACLTLPALILCSCGPRALEIPVVEDGWDIYTGGVYRYGPSIIANDDGSTDIWFAAPGAYYDHKNLKYDEKGATKPVALSGRATAAQRFTEGEPFYALRVVCPNNRQPGASLTLSLYRWKDDYGTTVRQRPIASQRYSNYVDNQDLELTSREKFPAGEYLWVLSDGVGKNSMVWHHEGTAPGTTSFLNGEPTDGCFRARISNEVSDGGFFWDQASYQHSTDGGRTWTEEKMVLLPTEYSSDHFSVCDPGVARWGGYYYAGYTSTENEGMVENHVYIARSENPDGPWEKWNGSGWTTGTDVQPMIKYTDDPAKFGAGEPSIVLVGDTIFFYYTWNGTGDESTTTRLATADANDPLWPAHLTYHGTVINKSDIKGADHCDVKYRDDIGKFQAIHSANRMGPQSYIVLWESEDGIHFTKKGELRDNVKPYLHNCGWSGDERGHMKKGVQQYLSYAYGSPTAVWGNWKTWFSPLKMAE